MSDVFGIGGVAQAAGSVAGSAIQANAISHASDVAAASADKAQNLLQGRYDTTRSDLQPFKDVGTNAMLVMNNNLPGYAQPDTYDLDQARGYFNQAAALGGPNSEQALEQTPGYQFTLAQGLQATQNSAAARGLGISGAAMKGAAAYATGLADQTYQQQFADKLALGTNALAVNTGVQGNRTNAFNRLLSTAGLGESAAAQTGNTGAVLGTAQGQAATAGGAASAAGSIGVGNALQGGINGVTNAFTQYQAQKQYDQQTGSNGYTGPDGSGGMWV